MFWIPHTLPNCLFYRFGINTQTCNALTCGRSIEETATSWLDYTPRNRALWPVHLIFHSFRCTSFKLLEKTVYLCFYTWGTSHIIYHSSFTLKLHYLYKILTVFGNCSRSVLLLRVIIMIFKSYIESGLRSVTSMERVHGWWKKLAHRDGAK